MKRPSPQRNNPRAAKRHGAGRPPKGRRLRYIAVCVLLVILVGLVFVQTLEHEFVNYDDNEYVYENSAVTSGLTWRGVEWAFTHVYSNNWHPLTWISHMLDCQIYGLWPGGHHLTNVLLHAAAAVILFLALCELTGALWRSAFVAAVFAIHPLRVESVAWVAERKDVLSGLFFMLTLWAYARYVGKANCRMELQRMRSNGQAFNGKWGMQCLRSGWYWGMVGFFALGLMSKPMLVTLPFVLLLLDYWPLRRSSSLRPSAFILLEKLPLFLLSAASCVATVVAQKEAIRLMDHLPFPMRIGNALVSFGVYLGQTIYPANLAVLYPMPESGWPLWQVIAATALLGGLTMWAWRQRRERAYLLTGWLWYLGMLTPVSGLIQVGLQAYADRYTYLPQIGLVLAGTSRMADWAGTQRWRRATLGWAAVAVLSGMMIAAVVQTSVWRDSITLWTHTLEWGRASYLAHNNLGNALLQQGQTEEAIVHFREALRIYPAYPDANNNLGNALLQQGRTTEGIAHFREALKINPAYADAHYNLGNALLRQGQTEEAIAHFQESLRINPDFAKSLTNLGNALLKQGRTQEALARFREALKSDPAYAEAHSSLGNALLLQRQVEEAITHFRDSLKIKPDFPEAHYNLGNALLQQGRTQDAAAEFREALKIKPAFPEARSNLGIALFQQGNKEEALAHFRVASKIDPTYGDAYSNLGSALLQLGRTVEAIEPLQTALELQPGNVAVRNTLAWVLATASPANLRDGARAVQLASQVDAATGGTNPVSLRTLAAAQAEAGNFPRAVQAAHAALQKAEAEANVDLAAKLRRELALYEAGQPFRESP